MIMEGFQRASAEAVNLIKDFKKILSIGYSLIMIGLTLSILFACTGDRMKTDKTTLPSIMDVPAGLWQNLSLKKIYFGHQSVGFNIIDGIKDIMKENHQIKLNIIETINPSDLNSPAFTHSPVGRNMNPKSKSDAFAGLINERLGNKVDIAFFKFCYVDIVPETNVSKLFEEYESTMSSLRAKYPRIVFVHFTVPVTTLQSGPKALMKKIIGRPVGGYEDNIKREEFNEKLRKRYAGKEPVFDLAFIESTNEAGSRVTFTHKGKTGYILAFEYTNDGGHLNDRGRKIVAEQLLIFLSKL